ncbi:MAG TPA: isochorismatase family protein [Burkholderiaceae bacterium]|nr:isochorismatase family protein [Burkholderiaceae bacterium]
MFRHDRAVPAFIARPAARLALALGLAAMGSMAQANTTIVDEWSVIKAPAAPELKAAQLDPKTTALLVLDFVNPNCTNRPRCMASVPAMKKLLAEARAKGMLVVFATGPTGKRADILPDLAPLDTETVVGAGVDKFANAELEKVLKAAGTQTVIATGTSAHGAVLYTASTASLRGMKVVLPVDGMSADTAFIEQFVAVHMTTAPLVSRNVALTRLDMIRF